MGDDPSYHDNDYDVINTCLVSDETTPSDNLLINLKGNFFEPAVGSRPNFNRICG